MMEGNLEEDFNELADLIENDELLINCDNNNTDDDSKKSNFGLKRQINLLSSVSLLIGLIIGSGIFASPRNVAIYAGSTGSILLVWVACGVISMFAGLVWCELGTMFPNVSGSEYSYLVEAFGPLCGFTYLYTNVIAIQSCGLAMISLVCGDYILTAFGSSEILYIKLIAAAVIGIVGFVNCANVIWAMRFQNIFTAAKLIGIVILVMTGLVRLAQGHNDNFIDAFNGSVTDISNISYAFYGGLWSFNGWNSANFIVAESTNPSRDLPLTIVIGMPFIILCYVMVNISYLTVLTPTQISNSGAVAVTLANQLYGKMAWVIPLLVACSTIGAANGSALISGRLLFDGARNGHMPKLLAMLHTKRHTPIPAILFNSFVALLILVPRSSSFVTLTSYFSFSTWMFYLWTTIGLLVLRYRKPHMKRPYKVFLGIPIILILCSVYLVVAPFYDYPMESLYCLLFIASSIPVYFAFVKYSIIPRPILTLYDKLTDKLQRTFNMSMPGVEVEDTSDEEMRP